MKRRLVVVTLTVLGASSALLTMVVLLATSTVPAHADARAPLIASGDGHNEARRAKAAPSSGAALTGCVQLLQIGGFEGDSGDVFAHWSAGGEGAFQRTGYYAHAGDFSMRLHASLGSYPACAALDPWLYQTVRIPLGISATTRITVEGYYAVGGSLADCSVADSVDVDDALTIQLRDGTGMPLTDPITITRGLDITGTSEITYRVGVTETWHHFGVDFTDGIDLPSLAGQEVQVYFHAIHDADAYGTWFYLDDLDCSVCPASAGLSIGKTGPTQASPGELITYTLTITNQMPITLTDVVITDVVPGGANLIRLVPTGTLVFPTALLPVAVWTVDELPPAGAAISVQFAVTASQTITNHDYGVSSAQGAAARGAVAVVTRVAQYAIYLPIVLRP